MGGFGGIFGGVPGEFVILQYYPTLSACCHRRLNITVRRYEPRDLATVTYSLCPGQTNPARRLPLRHRLKFTIEAAAHHSQSSTPKIT